MKENRRAWLDELAKAEGGYSDHPADNGGKTNRGITQATLAAWRGRPVTEADVRALTAEEAEAIASAQYWNQVKADQLPPGVDLYAADFAFNSGPRRAIKVCQQALGFEGQDVDGYVGPLTLNAIRQYSPRDLINGMHDARMKFLMGLDDWPTFGEGWKARCNSMRYAAMQLAPDQAPAVVVAQEKKTNKIVASVTGAGLTAAGVAPLIVDQLPAAKATFDQTRQALGPLAELSPWMQYVILAIAIGAAAGVLFLGVKVHGLLKEKSG